MSNSYLAKRIDFAVQSCNELNGAIVPGNDGISIKAEWTKSKNEGMQVIRITIMNENEDCFVYDDYGTERKIENMI